MECGESVGTRAQPARFVLAVTVAGCAVALGVYGYLSGPRRYFTAGNPYPGAFTSVTEVVGYFLTALLGAGCLGALIYVVVASRPRHDGLIDAQPFRIHVLGERLSLGWLFVSAVMVVVQASHDSGMSVVSVLMGAAVPDAVAASETSRGWIVTTLCALVVTVTLRLITRWVGHAVLLVPAMIGIVSVAVTGNAGQGPDHDYATSSVIVFAVAVAALCGVKIVFAHSGEPPRRLVLVLYVAAGVVALPYWVLLFCLHSVGSITGTDFGVLGLIVGVVLFAVWVADCLALRGSGRRGTVVASFGVAGAMVAALAALVAMAVQMPPRFLAHRFTAWDVFLGYELPRPPGVLSLIATWRFDTFLGTATVALAVGYLAGYLRLRCRGDSWPAGRLVAWLTGCAILVFTTGSGVRAYGSAMFSVHMAEHMILNMFIPVLLVLGGPLTLALRVLPASGDAQPPGPREWITWVLHSRVTTFFSRPGTAFVLFVASSYVVYFTPIIDTLIRYHWGHEFMAVHFLLVGYLFYWAIIGVDPGPRRLPYLARIGLLFAVMPFHAFFGIALMTMTTAVGSTFYRYVNLPWLSSIQSDQHLGGAIAWGATELPVIIVIIALVAQWARQDRRVSDREDRRADSGYGDDDLDAYNAMLRELAQSR